MHETGHAYCIPALIQSNNYVTASSCWYTRPRRFSITVQNPLTYRSRLLHATISRQSSSAPFVISISSFELWKKNHWRMITLSEKCIKRIRVMHNSMYLTYTCIYNVIYNTAHRHTLSYQYLFPGVHMLTHVQIT